MKLNFIKNISLPKVTGISKFICVDIHPEYIKLSFIKNKEPFYNIYKKNSVENLCIVATECIRGNDLNSTIGTLIIELATRHSFSDAAVIAGINDFKYSTASIPADTEDIEAWFEENRSKFLPEGRLAEEFAFSYEQYKEDDNHKNYYHIIARNDFITSIYDACKSSELRFLGILPYSLLLFNFAEDSKNTLFLDIEESKIYYSFKSNNGNILYRDTFFDIYENNGTEEDIPIENRRINPGTLNFFLEELRQTLTLTFGADATQNLNVFLVSHQNHFESAEAQLKKMFGHESICRLGSKEDVFYSSSLMAVNKILNDTDTQLNILSKESFDYERNLLEKQTSFRVVIASGALLLIMLLSAYFLENYLNSRLESEEANYIELAAKAGNVGKLKKVNSYLKSNLALLSKLKGNRAEYSSLLYDITKIINSGSCLTGFNLKENQAEQILVEFSGLGHSQQDVAEFMSNMEYSKKFSDITLIFSASLKESKQQTFGALSEDDYVNFKITAKYHADTK